jgi:hypothetical protein
VVHEVDFIIISIIIKIMEQKFVVTEVEGLREDDEERSGGGGGAELWNVQNK